MSLLAYPWPGNVREIEWVCENFNIVPSLSSIDRFAVSGIKLYLGLKEENINIKEIETVLSDVRDEFSKQDIFETDPRFGFLVCRETETLKNAREKLRRFFSFLLRNENSVFSDMTPPYSRNAGEYMSYDEIRRSYFKDLLAGCKYNQMQAAEKAGINYTTFRSMLKKLGITEWLQSVKNESESVSAAA
jgi:DNA-binding NtrC family response regulator